MVRSTCWKNLRLCTEQVSIQRILRTSSPSTHNFFGVPTMMHMNDQLSAMMGHPLYGFPPQVEQENIPTERPRKKARTSVPKRSPYTRLACFSCRDKHQKCDGGQPVCYNCMSKGLECRYREERNKRKCVQKLCESVLTCSRDTDGSSPAEIENLRAQIELWKQKYFDLKRFVGTHSLLIAPLISLDETLYHISLSQQLMPFMTQPASLTSDSKLNDTLSINDPMMPTGLNSFDLLSQPGLNMEGITLCMCASLTTMQDRICFLPTYYSPTWRQTWWLHQKLLKFMFQTIPYLEPNNLANYEA